MRKQSKFLQFILLFSFVFTALVSESSAAGTGLKLPSTYTTKDAKLILNGQGVRNKLWIDLFIGGLYLKTKSNDATKIVQSNEEMSIRIHVISNVITSKRLKENMDSEFKRVCGGNISKYQSRIDKLTSTFNEDVKVGDVFDLIYTPDGGLQILKNNQLKASVEGLDFKQMLFSIWLGNDPQDNNLKQGMLGNN